MVIVSVSISVLQRTDTFVNGVAAWPFSRVWATEAHYSPHRFTNILRRFLNRLEEWCSISTYNAGESRYHPREQYLHYVWIDRSILQYLRSLFSFVISEPKFSLDLIEMSVHVESFDNILGCRPLKILFLFENRIRLLVGEFSLAWKPLSSASSASCASGVSGDVPLEGIVTSEFGSWPSKTLDKDVRETVRFLVRNSSRLRTTKQAFSRQVFWHLQQTRPIGERLSTLTYHYSLLHPLILALTYNQQCK